MYTQGCPYYTQNIYHAHGMPYMRNEQPAQMVSPEATMPESQLAGMYPNAYYIIYPQVIHHCDMFDRTYGTMRIPTREEMRQMVDEISTNVEPDVEASMKSEMREYDVNDSESRQFGFGARGLLRDLVGVLLLRELFDRRHRPHHHYKHHYRGY